MTAQSNASAVADKRPSKPAASRLQEAAPQAPGAVPHSAEPLSGAGLEVVRGRQGLSGAGKSETERSGVSETIETEDCIIDAATGAILRRKDVKEGFRVVDLPSADWCLRHRAKDEQRLADIVACRDAAKRAACEEIDEEYARQIATLQKKADWWKQYDQDLEFLAMGQTIDGDERSVKLGKFRFGFRKSPGTLQLREGVADKWSPLSPVDVPPPLFLWLRDRAPTAVKTTLGFLVSKLPKDLDPVQSRPDLFERTPDTDAFYIETGVTKTSRPAIIQPEQPGATDAGLPAADGPAAA